MTRRAPSIGQYVAGASPARKRLMECENQRFMAHPYGEALHSFLRDRTPPRAGTFLRAVYDEYVSHLAPIETASA